MPRHFRFLRHPLHPALVHFPMGLLPLSFLWDLISLWRGTGGLSEAAFWGSFAFWTLVAGLVALLPALGTGFLDFLAIPDENQGALTAAYWHIGVMILAASLFTVSLFLRMGIETPVRPTPLFALVFSALGALTLLAGGYLGGKLVYEYGIGHEEKK